MMPWADEYLESEGSSRIVIPVPRKRLSGSINEPKNLEHDIQGLSSSLARMGLNCSQNNPENIRPLAKKIYAIIKDFQFNPPRANS
jgi:hypothetical protein